jgi:type II secretory pathway pseudopilin PulG
MAATHNCATCGQANSADSEYCVRCGGRMPLEANTPGDVAADQGGETSPQAYPWEPPAEWDPGDLPPSAQQGPAPTWVGRSGDQQQAWNVSGGGSTGAGMGGSPQWGGQQPPPGGPGGPGSVPPRRSGGSKKPIFIVAGVVVIIAAIVAGVLVATSGGKSDKTALNGVQNQSANDALTSTRVALRGAKSVHLTGTVKSDGQPIRLDLTLAGNDSKGTLTINNNDVQLIKIDQSVYIKGDPDFLKTYAKGNTAAVDALNGRWLKTATTSDFDNFSIDGFANELKGGSGGAKVNPKVTQSTLNGKKVVVISQTDGSTLTIANTGPAYPLALSSKGDSGGQVTFSDYNAPASITAPTDVLDLSSSTPTEPTETPTPSSTDASAILGGSYSCTDNSGDSNGGTLTLTASTNKYTVSGGATGGFWGTSGQAIAFSSGALDQFSGTFTGDAGSLVLKITGKGSNADVSYTCSEK